MSDRAPEWLRPSALACAALVACTSPSEVFLSLPTGPGQKTLLLLLEDGTRRELRALDLGEQADLDAWHLELSETDATLTALGYEEALLELGLVEGEISLGGPPPQRPLPPAASVLSADLRAGEWKSAPADLLDHLASIRLSALCPLVTPETLWTGSSTGAVQFLVPAPGGGLLGGFALPSASEWLLVKLSVEPPSAEEIVMAGRAPSSGATDGEGRVFVVVQSMLSELHLDPPRLEPVGSLGEEDEQYFRLAVARVGGVLDGFAMSVSGRIKHFSGSFLAQDVAQVGAPEELSGTGGLAWTGPQSCVAGRVDADLPVRVQAGRVYEDELPLPSFGSRAVAYFEGTGMLFAEQTLGNVFRFGEGKWSLLGAAMADILALAPHEPRGFAYLAASGELGFYSPWVGLDCPRQSSAPFIRSQLSMVAVEQGYVVAANVGEIPSVQLMRRVGTR